MTVMTIEQKLNLLNLSQKEQLRDMINETFGYDLSWPDCVAIYLEIRPIKSVIGMDSLEIREAFISHLDWILEGICENSLIN